MSRTLHADVITALAQPTVRYMYMVDLQLDSDHLAFNSTLATHTYGAVDFIGAGNLGSVGEISESPGLDPGGCDVTLSGINTALLAVILGEEYLNRRGIIYIALLDDDNQIIGDPFIYFDGLIDSLSVNYSTTAAVTVSLKDRLVTWNREKVELWTHEEQQAQHPGDKGLEFVNAIAEREIIWPAATWFEANR